MVHTFVHLEARFPKLWFKIFAFIQLSLSFLHKNWMHFIKSFQGCHSFIKGTQINLNQTKDYGLLHMVL